MLKRLATASVRPSPQYVAGLMKCVYHAMFFCNSPARYREQNRSNQYQSSSLQPVKTGHLRNKSYQTLLQTCQHGSLSSMLATLNLDSNANILPAAGMCCSAKTSCNINDAVTPLFRTVTPCLCVNWLSFRYEFLMRIVVAAAIFRCR